MTQNDALQEPIVLLGGGLTWSDDEHRIGLSDRTFHRLWALHARSVTLAKGAFVLCSGGYSKMDNVNGVHRGQEEGYQMADWLMREAGLSADQIEVDPTPESTIGNMVGAVRGGWVDLDTWRRGLTVVTHTWHLPRVQMVAQELGIRDIELIDAGIQGASPYEHISREAHSVVLRGVGRSALLDDPGRYEAAIGSYIESQRNKSA